MEFKDIKNIVDLMKKNSISDFELEKEGFKIKLHRTDGSKTENVQLQSYIPPAAAQTIPVPSAIPASAAVAPETSANESNNSSDPEIKSPMIGTFYRSPNPESDPFVSEGDSIKVGQTICIVEAMKLFNDIESEVSGKIVKILVDDNSPVEFDQPIFEIDPS